MTLATKSEQTALDLKQQIQKLNTIGIALSGEHNLHDLLELIVKEARNFTHADGASLYIKEQNRLKFVVSQTGSLSNQNGKNQPFSSFYLP
ncbi:hypothetical protein MJD09_08155, partial [bacterium]|nr:hypothetical protein [bacterium]